MNIEPMVADICINDQLDRPDVDEVVRQVLTLNNTTKRSSHPKARDLVRKYNLSPTHMDEMTCVDLVSHWPFE